MVAPLLDSRGTTRYFIGAQVDVSGLCKDCTDLHGLRRMLAKQGKANDPFSAEESQDKKDEFRQLSEMLNSNELEIARKHGGGMHRQRVDELGENNQKRRDERPRLLLKEPTSPSYGVDVTSGGKNNGKLEGIYQNVSLPFPFPRLCILMNRKYLLIRPYPSLRILFSSPALRVPGILQSPFMSRIGGSARVRDELTAALAEGRGVTAKVRWVSGRHGEEEGRVRWIHCTPLLGQNGTVGVWMVVLVDDEATAPMRRFRNAPPVSTDIGTTKYRNANRDTVTSNFGESTRRNSMNRGSVSMSTPGTPRAERPGTSYSAGGASIGGGSLQSFALG
jgi:hypothetical protein